MLEPSDFSHGEHRRIIKEMQQQLKHGMSPDYGTINFLSLESSSYEWLLRIEKVVTPQDLPGLIKRFNVGAKIKSLSKKAQEVEALSRAGLSFKKELIELERAIGWIKAGI